MIWCTEVKREVTGHAGQLRSSLGVGPECHGRKGAGQGTGQVSGSDISVEHRGHGAGAVRKFVKVAGVKNEIGTRMYG